MSNEKLVTLARAWGRHHLALAEMRSATDDAGRRVYHHLAQAWSFRVEREAGGEAHRFEWTPDGCEIDGIPFRYDP